MMARLMLDPWQTNDNERLSAASRALSSVITNLKARAKRSRTEVSLADCAAFCASACKRSAFLTSASSSGLSRGPMAQCVGRCLSDLATLPNQSLSDHQPLVGSVLTTAAQSGVSLASFAFRQAILRPPPRSTSAQRAWLSARQAAMRPPRSPRRPSPR